MPTDLSIKTVALWLRDSLPGRVWPTDEIDIDFVVQAEAVRALVQRKVKEAVLESAGEYIYIGMGDDGRPEYHMDRVARIVSRVLGSWADDPQR